MSCRRSLATLAVLPWLLASGRGATGGHPRDQQLVRAFAERRAAFAELLALVREERRVTRIAPDFIRIDAMQSVAERDRRRYLTDARFARYRALFDALSLAGGVERHADGDVDLIVSSGGFVTGGSTKGYLWSPRPPADVLAPSDPRSLERACRPRSNCTAARRITGDWYIVLERY